MLENTFNERIKIQDIVNSQVPQFILYENPKFLDFLKQYYISQEYPGGPVDILDNLDIYLKLDNLIPEVFADDIFITNSITSTDTTIQVTSTKGFPNKYGLLKIDDEIITYTETTPNSFLGCVRGFSGITNFHKTNEPDELVFSTSSSASHAQNSKITNLSSLFLKEFFTKVKYLLTPGLENIDFSTEINVSNFIKLARSFFQSKGTEESFKILFKVLYGENIQVVDLENYLLKPSSAEFLRRDIVIVEALYGNPLKIVGQSIRKFSDPNTLAYVSEVELIKRGQKYYYKLSLFVGYTIEQVTTGIFSIQPKTKVTEKTLPGSNVISVDSTIGFPKSGTLISGNNVIQYSKKTINQFINCSNITEQINPADDILINDYIISYENGDTSKEIRMRITGVISGIEKNNEIYGLTENDYIRVKSIGEVIRNKNATTKQIFANSWVYNTSSRYQIKSIAGSTAILKSEIDKSSLKVGDEIEILIRGTQTVVTSPINIAIISSITLTTSEISFNNLTDLNGNPFNPSDPNSIYYNRDFDLRRKLRKSSSLNVPLDIGNNKILSNILNVYNEYDSNYYVASNGLPSYLITKQIIKKTIDNASESVLEDFNETTKKYASVVLLNHPFQTGDSVIYQCSNKNIPELNPEENYYVSVVSPNSIRLYESRSFIGSINYIELTPLSIDDGSHSFTLEEHVSNTISPQSIFRKFPSERNFSLGNFYPTKLVKNLGLLSNGVEIINSRYGDKIYYGPIERIDILNGGNDYDVLNPPKLEVSKPSIGTTCLVQPILSGEIREIIIDPIDFDITSVLSVKISGGNGKNCNVETFLGNKFREVEFDGRKIIDGGGIDVINETITFLTEHKFSNGQEIIYNSEGNDVGIGIFGGSNLNQDRNLVDGASYYAKILNSKTIQLHESLSDYSAGINTVGFTTVNLFGIHRFRTVKQKTISSVKVIDPGIGYENRKLFVKPSGISLEKDSIYFPNHGFSNKEIVEYSPTDVGVVGILTTKQYYVVKIDEDNFRLCDAGSIGSDPDDSDYNRKKYITFSNIGSGYHVFKYPDIKVDVVVSYGSTFVGLVTATPVVKGKFIGAYVYESGTGYGSTIVNLERKPKLTFRTGKNGAVRPVVVNGKISRVEIESAGTDYYSTPELQVIGDGYGAKLRAVVLNRKLSRVIVVNTGEGYRKENTRVKVVSSGNGAILDPKIRSLSIDSRSKYGNEILVKTTNNLQYGLTCYDPSIAIAEFKDDGSSHSPIIGWAYDGNPIYGSYGYSDPEDNTSDLKLLNSSYSSNLSNIPDRPPGFTVGFFVEDYKFTNSGDLDIYNGRWCKTPEFPNGTYAYFATSNIPANTVQYPYFIGDYFRSPYIEENSYLDQEFNFKEKGLIRNTFPYKINDRFSDNDFIIESNEVISQKLNIDSVTSGSVESFTIVEPGTNYKVGDKLLIDNPEEGEGFSADVSYVEGKQINSIDTEVELYDDFKFVWENKSQISAYISTYHSLANNDIVNISGVSTYIKNLQKNHRVIVSDDKFILISDLNPSGDVEDIYVSNIPNTIRPDSILNIENEELKVLNIFSEKNILRVKRGDVGSYHSTSTEIYPKPNKFIVDLKTDYFNSNIQSKIYFNPALSVGIGTTSGLSLSFTSQVGEEPISYETQTQTIYLPNHPFKTGQELKLTKPSSTSTLLISNTPEESPFNLPESTNSQIVYVINKSPNSIGIVTLKSQVYTTNGVYFSSFGSDDYEYSLETTLNQVTGKVEKNKTLVSLSTAHFLKSGDTIKLSVTPNLTVGFGNSSTAKVVYNSQIKNIVINPQYFANSNVSVLNDTISLTDHRLNTGDKILYRMISGGVVGGLLNNTSYFVYKVDKNTIKLGETYFDVIKDNPNTINLTSTGGSVHYVALINPEIKVCRNNNIIFDVSDSSLSPYKFKIYYDKDLNNEFISAESSTDFNISGFGTVGVSTNATVTLNYSENIPEFLYYSLEKDGEPVPPDTEIKYFSRISFVNSVYNGEYFVSGIQTNSFVINVKDTVESSSYTKFNCDVLKYSTNSESSLGGISDVRIISGGYGYKQLPNCYAIESEKGKDGSIDLKSLQIGRVKTLSVLNQGYEYSIDNTIRPDAYIPPILNLKNTDKITSVQVLDGGRNFLATPSIVIFNPYSKEVVNAGLLNPKLSSSSISSVDIVSTPFGLSSVQHKLFTVNNTNGVGVVSITSYISGQVSCSLITPVIGFTIQPFKIGDKIYVEGIQKYGQNGTGFNSEDYDYEFFTVTNYLNSNPAIVEFDLSEYTVNAGLAVTFPTRSVKIINYDDYPKFNVIQERSKFLENETLLKKIGSEFVELDLRVVSSFAEVLRVDGSYDELFENDILKGKSSGSIVTISSINLNNGLLEVDYSSKQNLGWKNDTGKLNLEYQVLPDNNYYQNLSYSIKSTKQFEDISGSVNQILHPVGLKNFSDTQVSSSATTYTQQGESFDAIVLDISSENRVDTINDFDLSIDTNVVDNSSQSVKFKTKRLANYIDCISNAAIKVDDISQFFVNLDNRSQNSSTYKELLNYNESFSSFLVEIKNPASGDVQLTELVTLSDEENIFTLEKSNVYSTEVPLGDVSGYINGLGIQQLILNPTDPYDTDLDIKVLKSNFSTVDVGIGQTNLGFISLSGSISTASPGAGTTIISFSAENNSAFYVSVQVVNTSTTESNFVDLYLTHDGTDTYMSEYYFDSNEELLSGNFIGSFTSSINSGILKIQHNNSYPSDILLRSKIVGFGSTALGISTYRFKTIDQPDGGELTARYESNYNISSGISTVFSFNVDEISSVKSLVKVSVGNTVSMHQVIVTRSGTGNYIMRQYPILAVNTTVGMGTFSIQENAFIADLLFYPDPENSENVKIESYNQLINLLYDEFNIPNELQYGNIRESYSLTFFDAINGERYNKTAFEMRYNNTPIFLKTFNPKNSAILDPNTGIFTIRNHFFSTGERLIYTPGSTFTGIGGSAMGIGATTNSLGIVTTLLPNDVYPIVINNDQFKLATTVGFATVGIFVTFTSYGTGNVHTLEMSKKLEKSIISLDGVVQSPIKWTPISHTLAYNGGQITGSATTFSLSGISTIYPEDILKIDDEFVRVIGVGLGTESYGPISGIGTYKLAYVDRSVIGSSATTHTDSTEVRVYRGSYNFVKNKIHFISPPKGEVIEGENFTNLPRESSSFDGRVFLRRDYTTNVLYDDISDQFTGIGNSMRLTVQGINTTGIETGNSLLFLNDIFQTPTTENNIGNNYYFGEYSGETKVIFTGITSSNGQIIVSETDINQNQLPRSGVIISLGSTPGLGFAPLVGASLTSWSGRVNVSGGSIISVAMGKSDNPGSGYFGQVSIGVTQVGHTGNAAVIRANVGSGGTITGFTVVSGGSGYSSDPDLLIPDPRYENLPIVGVSREGVGLTTDTGIGLLMNVEVSPSLESVGIGTSVFSVSSFKITRPGYGFKIGDVFKPVGLVTAKGLASPIQDFTLTVTNTFTDSFASWQVGELDYIDSISNLQDGLRKRFPIKYQGQLLTFETSNPIINLANVLLIFIDGVIQTPGVSYQYSGGSSFVFTEPPKPENNVAIFFYRGTRELDSLIVDVVETIKPGDTIQLLKNSYLADSISQEPRTVVGISTSDEVETNTYYGKGIETDPNRYKPLSWTKQKADKLINGEYFYKSRDSIEALVYPTAKVIRNIAPTDNEIFVDNASFFNYEENESVIEVVDFGAILIPNYSIVSASATCVVSSAGTIQNIIINNPGLGYTTSSVDLKIASPLNTYTGVTAEASALISNGSVSSTITITNPGLGYSQSKPPNVIIELPSFSVENIEDIKTVEGFCGIVTGIGTTTGTGSNPLAIKFGLKATDINSFTSLQPGYPIYIYNTKVGHGITSIDSNDASVVGVGTTFLDNIYYVASFAPGSPVGNNAEIIVNVKSNSNILGVAGIGSLTKPLGEFSWGRLSLMKRTSPLSIGVTGLTIDSGLSTFPTIQRRGYGFKLSGAVNENLL